MGDYFFSPTFEAPKREGSVLDVPSPTEEPQRPRESKRKRIDREQREEEEKEKAALVVVGYESKMFRDPETAAAVNEGKFLVPWMGDKTLMIDRYDVRLLLDDRKLFKKVKGGKTRVMTKEEAEEEAQCDYERYYDLEHHEEEIEKGSALLPLSPTPCSPETTLPCAPLPLFFCNFFIFLNWTGIAQVLMWTLRFTISLSLHKATFLFTNDY